MLHSNSTQFCGLFYKMLHQPHNHVTSNLKKAFSAEGTANHEINVETEERLKSFTIF